MKKLFVCLANSKKYYQRCIAGIELQPSQVPGRRYEVVRREDDPVWLRPVSQREHGEVPVELVEHINLLDVVEVQVTRAVPQEFQTENALFVQERLAVVYRVGKTAALVDKLVSSKPPPLFGTVQKMLSASEAARVDHSLLLVKPEYPQLLGSVSAKGTPQVKASFIYDGVSYTLPMTDLEAEAQFNKNPTFLEAYPNVYFTLSLSREFNGQHYKLVAGIVYF